MSKRKLKVGKRLRFIIIPTVRIHPLKEKKQKEKRLFLCRNGMMEKNNELTLIWTSFCYLATECEP